MKIIGIEDFLKEPLGTVYCNFVPRYYSSGQLKIKCKWLSDDDNKAWWEAELLPWFESEMYEEKYDGEENPMEWFLTRINDYHYDKDVLFCVFNKKEINGMIENLKTALEMNPNA